MAISKLSRQDEERISSAMSAVVDMTNSGTPPNEAIFKTASKDKMSAGFVRLMCSAYNNGVSLHCIRSGDTVASKVAEMPLADAKDVLIRMFPDSPETPATESRQKVSSEYEAPPVRSMRPMTRLDHAMLITPPPAYKRKSDPLPKYRVKKQARAFSKFHNLKDKASKTAGSLTNTAFEFEKARLALANYFRTQDRIPFGTVRKMAEAQYGNKAARLLGTLAGEHTWLDKQADDGNPLVDWSREPYSQIERCFELASNFLALKEKTAADNSEYAKHAEDLFSPFDEANTEHIYGSVLDHQEKQAANVMAPVGIGAIIGNSASNVAAKMKERQNQVIKEKMEELSSPAHEDNLRTIRTTAMLHDFMLNDPIISGYDPRQIIEAFNSISSTAPRAADRSLMMRPLIRKYLEQGIMDPFDSDMLAGTERTLQQIDTLAPTPPQQPKLPLEPQKGK